MSKDMESNLCAIGFDIWGTLFDLNNTLRIIAFNIAELLGINASDAVQRILKIHEEAKEIRRRKPEIPIQDLLKASRDLLAKAFNEEPEKVDLAMEKAFKNSSYNILFDDVEPALKKLNEIDIKMGIIGNVLFWPSKYTRLLLEKTGIIKYFKITIFSDEIGIFKPDRKIFLVFAERLGIEPSRIIYVGDNVVEDVGGALSSGGVGVLISRSVGRSIVVRELRVALINKLTELIDVYRALCN